MSVDHYSGIPLMHFWLRSAQEIEGVDPESETASNSGTASQIMPVTAYMLMFLGRRLNGDHTFDLLLHLAVQLYFITIIFVISGVYRDHR